MSNAVRSPLTVQRPKFVRVRSLLRSAATSLVIGTVGMASAAVITTNEAALDAIFSQASFGSKTIDVRFTASQTIYDTALLSIDSLMEWNQLALFDGRSLSPVINMFFVDGMTWCGETVSNTTVGCASTPGNMLMLDSDWTSGANGGALMAHELAHNLNLGHETGTNTNLMNSFLSGNITLTTTQANTILTSSLIQTSAGQRYITITPILVAASVTPVPEPESWAMMVAGLLGIGTWVRRRKSQTS